MQLVNALSLQMLPSDFGLGNLLIQKIDTKRASDLLKSEGAESYIGHTDTANVLSGLLGIAVECNRGLLRLDTGKRIMVAQLVGGRLPEGCMTLPQGCRFEFYLVTLAR